MATPPTDLFTRLARKGARLNVQPKDWERAILLRFWRVEGTTMILKIESELPAPLTVGLPVWGVFENMGRVRTFTSDVVEVVRKPDDSIVGIRISVPDEVKSEDRRRAFRVPKVAPFAVRATLQSGDHVWQPVVVNLSVLGVLIQLPEEIAKALDDGAPYKLVFDTFEGSATVGAQVVRRVRGGKIALKFPGSIKMGEVAPSPDLAKVVRFAELLWMRRRGGSSQGGSQAA